MKYLVSLLALALLAGVANAQCAGGTCPLGLRLQASTQYRATVRTQAVTQSGAPAARPVQAVQVRQRVRLFRR